MIGWGTPREVALYVNRPIRTIRTWAARGQIPSACDLDTGLMVVHAATTARHAESTKPREGLLTRAS